MVIDLFRWPLQAWHFQEVIGAAVQSFSLEGRGFSETKSAREQLRERILEMQLPNQPEALKLVQNFLTEGECLDICLSLHVGCNGHDGNRTFLQD